MNKYSQNLKKKRKSNSSIPFHKATCRIAGCLVIILCLLGSSVVSAQEKQQKQKSRKRIAVSGYVTDISGNPAQGVSIFIDGRKSNIATNSHGYYSIKVKPGTKTISAFSLFQGIHEVNYEGQERVDFVLGGNAEEKLQQEAKDEMGTPVSTVNMDKADKTMYSNIYQMIKGEVPGVNVSGTKITIRSSTSITQSTEPLFFLDDVMVDDIDGIPPEIVKSIEVLKGPATAIYGSRGANGVILIKTK